ncbi:MAG: thiamine-phosphate kinase [Verrucomicrobiota bacterium]
MSRLADLGEEEVLRRLLIDLPTRPDLQVGPGDDCAVVSLPGREDRLGLLKTDAVVSSIHFPEHEDLERVGWKALARNLSDVAAMGGRPEHGLVTVLASPEREIEGLEALYRGLRKCAQSHEVSLAGGDLGSLPRGGAHLVVSVALSGSVAADQCVLRSGAAEKDLLLVTGRLGGSFASGRHLDFRPRLAEGRFLAEQGVTAMMDLSDGLAADLPRLCRASQVGAWLTRESLPRHQGVDVKGALHEGEDYELLATVPPEKWTPLSLSWQKAFPDLPLTCIGEIVAKGQGEEFAGGWQHYHS